MGVENKNYKDQVKISLIEDPKYFQYLQEKYMKIVKITRRKKLKSLIYKNDDIVTRGNSVLGEKVPKFKKSSMLLDMKNLSKPKERELVSKFRPTQSKFSK